MTRVCTIGIHPDIERFQAIVYLLGSQCMSRSQTMGTGLPCLYIEQDLEQGRNLG